MAEYANFFTILALVATLFWQSRVIHKTETERDRMRLELGGKLHRAHSEILALKSELFDANNKPIRVCEACATHPCKCE